MEVVCVRQLAVGHFGVGAPPILVYFSGVWDIHWGYDLGFDPWPASATESLGLSVCSSGLPRRGREPGLLWDRGLQAIGSTVSMHSLRRLMATSVRINGR